MVFIQYSILKLYLGSLNLYKETSSDFVDHFHMKITPVLFMCFSILSVVKLLFFVQISCATPLEWRDSWTDYANEVCFVEGTYLQLFQNGTLRQVKKMIFYLWIPYLMVVLSGLSSLPLVLWSCIRFFFKIDINHILKTVASWNEDVKNTEHAMEYITNMFNNTYVLREKSDKEKSGLIGNRVMLDGSWMIIGYLTTKLACVANSILVLNLVRIFVQEQSLLFGWHLLMGWLTKSHPVSSHSFPRVGLCDIGRGVRHTSVLRTIQCVLPANSLYEKITIFIWWWMLMGIVMMGYSFIRWTVFLIRVARFRYLENQLSVCTNVTDDTEPLKIHHFKCLYLRTDGIFILRLVEINFGLIDMLTILSEFWSRFESMYDKSL